MFGHNIVIKTCVWALKLIFEILRSTVFKNLSRKMNEVIRAKLFAVLIQTIEDQ